jgi:hypothetical protein
MGIAVGHYPLDPMSTHQTVVLGRGEPRVGRGERAPTGFSHVEEIYLDRDCVGAGFPRPTRNPPIQRRISKSGNGQSAPIPHPLFKKYLAFGHLETFAL